MKKYKLHWLGGKVEDVEGTDIADACNRAGYGGGAMRALDYYSQQPDVVTDEPTMQPRAVYRQKRGKWELVCRCERLEDAVTIAKYLDEFERAYIYAYINDSGQLVEV